MVLLELLGHACEWAYITAVNLTQSTDVEAKCAGYLVCAALLPAGHELVLLTVNAIVRDLESASPVVAHAALGAAARLLPAEAVVQTLPRVRALLAHPEVFVRRRAVAALHALWRRAPDEVDHAELVDAAAGALCDASPLVMAASAPLVADLVEAAPAAHVRLVPALVSILRQVGEGRLPCETAYHKVPAPWLQVALLRALGALGANNRTASEEIYVTLFETLKRAEAAYAKGGTRRQAAACAVLLECVRAAAQVYPNQRLLEAAASATASVLLRVGGSEAHPNARFWGLSALMAIVRVDSRHVDAHQDLVLDCLESSDPLLGLRSLDLLQLMASEDNAEVVVERHAQWARRQRAASATAMGTGSNVTRVVEQAMRIAERYAPSSTWYVRAAADLLAAGGELAPAFAAHRLCATVAEGTGDPDIDRGELHAPAARVMLDVLERPRTKQSRPILQAAVWLVSEYGGAADDAAGSDETDGAAAMPAKGDEGSAQRRSIAALTTTAARAGEDEDYELHAAAISALAKACAHLASSASPSSVPTEARRTLERAAASPSADVAQRAFEAIAILSIDSRSLLEAVFPYDGAAEDVDLDAVTALSCLDGFVADALAHGAAPYDPPESAMLREAELAAATAAASAAAETTAATLEDMSLALGGSGFDPDGILGRLPEAEETPAVPEEPTLHLNVRVAPGQRRWGPVAAPRAALPSTVQESGTEPSLLGGSPVADAREDSMPAGIGVGSAAAIAPGQLSPSPWRGEAPRHASHAVAEDTARSKLARSLFGGPSRPGSAGVAAADARRATARKPPATAPPPAAAAAQQAPDDMLGGLAGLTVPSPTAPSKGAAAEPQQASGGLDDLLGIGTAGSSSADAPRDAIAELLAQPKASATAAFRLPPGSKPMSKESPQAKDPFADLLG